MTQIELHDNGIIGIQKNEMLVYVHLARQEMHVLIQSKLSLRPL